MGEYVTIKRYSPVYRFTVDDKKYEATEFKYYRKGLPKVGDTVKILIDPDDPVSIREPERAKRELIINIITGIMMFIAGSGLMTLFAVTGIGIFER